MQATPDQAPEGAFRILVVDDDSQLLKAISLGLSHSGFEVWTAKSGDEARAMIDRGRIPDLLLTDAMMPGDLQGPELLDYAKHTLPGLPAVLMSAYAGTGRLTTEGVKNADMIVAKPFNLKELLSELATLLGSMEENWFNDAGLPTSGFDKKVDC